jgi:hypothetical protein
MDPTDAQNIGMNSKNLQGGIFFDYSVFTFSIAQVSTFFSLILISTFLLSNLGTIFWIIWNMSINKVNVYESLFNANGYPTLAFIYYIIIHFASILNNAFVLFMRSTAEYTISDKIIFGHMPRIYLFLFCIQLYFSTYQIADFAAFYNKNKMLLCALTGAIFLNLIVSSYMAFVLMFDKSRCTINALATFELTVRFILICIGCYLPYRINRYLLKMKVQ